MLYTTDVACSLLNKFINALSQAEFQKCLALLLVLFSVIPTINVFGDSFGINGGYSLLWFIVLYCIAAYVRRYPLKNRKYGLGISSMLHGTCCT